MGSPPNRNGVARRFCALLYPVNSGGPCLAYRLLLYFLLKEVNKHFVRFTKKMHILLKN